MQENRDLQLAVDLYKSQVKVKDNYAKRVLKENNELRKQIKSLRKKSISLFVSYMVVAVIVSFVIALDKEGAIEMSVVKDNEFWKEVYYYMEKHYCYKDEAVRSWRLSSIVRTRKE